MLRALLLASSLVLAAHAGSDLTITKAISFSTGPALTAWDAGLPKDARLKLAIVVMR
jgi:hypothetical protein